MNFSSHAKSNADTAGKPRPLNQTSGLLTIAFLLHASSRKHTIRPFFWKLAAFLLLNGLFGASALPAKTASQHIPDISIRKGVVRVKVFPVSQNYIYPWVQGPGRSFTAFGLVVPRNRILMRAEDVRKAGLLQVQKYSSYELKEAVVEHIDMEANLALIRVQDKAFFSDLLPLPSGKEPQPGDKAEAIKIDPLFRVYREEVRITNIKTVADFGFTHLPSLVFRADENFRKGGLLLCKTRLCGMVSYATSKRVEASPISVLDSFRKRVLSKERPFVSSGFYLANMIDPSRRSYFGMKANMTGALVTRVLPGTSAWGALQKKDILLAIEGTPLDNAGYYKTADGSKRPASMLFVRENGRLRKPGETIHLRILRKKKIKTIRLKLKAYTGGAERIPWLVDRRPFWLIQNGVLFLELSLPLLRQVYGSSWKSRATQLAKIFAEKQYYSQPSQERIIVMARVFPDPINRGYEKIFMKTVSLVGSQAPKNLRHMDKLLKQAKSSGKKNMVVRLKNGLRIYLDLTSQPKTENRILKKYRISKAVYLGDNQGPKT